MNEKTLTEALICSTKQILAGSEVVKLSDKATIGIPDLCVNWGGATWWVEVKYLRKGHTLEREWKPIQRHFLMRLQQTTGKGLLFVYSDQDGERGILATLYRSLGVHGVEPEHEIAEYDCRFGPKRHALLGESIKIMMHL